MRRRSVAAGALALASGTLLAAVGPASPAGAAPVAAPAFFSGATQGDVVQVALNLPAAVPGLGQNVALGLISASGTAVHDTINHTGEASKSFAGLASGSLVEGANAPLAALHRTVEATLAKPLAKDSLVELPANPIISGGAGLLNATVSKVLDNASDANLAAANVGKLGDVLPADVFTNLQQVTQPVLSQTTDVVNQVIGNLNAITSQDPTGTLQGVTSALTNLNNQVLPNLVSDLQNQALVKLSLLDAKQAIGLAGAGEQSQAHVKLAGLDVLGGLVHVDAFASDAQAYADGIAGHGKAGFNPVIAHATIGKSVLGVSLDANGLGLNVGGVPNDLVSQVNAGLQQVQDALNSLLSTLGVSIKPAAGYSEVSKDGTHAKAVGGALIITVANPLTSLAGNKAAAAAAPLLEVKLGGTTAEANAKQQVIQVRPAALPHTGGNLPLTAGIGAAFLLGAGLIRRRVLS